MALIPHESKLRRVLIRFGAAVTEQVLTTKDLTRIMGVPMGFHPIIVGMFGRQLSGTTQGDLIAYIDPVNTENIVTTSYNIVTAGGIEGTVLSRKILWITNIGGGGNHDRDRFFFNCWDKILLLKNSSLDWQLIIEYQLFRGSMSWLDEWAEMIRDKRNVSRKERSAGSEYHKVGDYWQIGKRENP